MLIVIFLSLVSMGVGGEFLCSALVAQTGPLVRRPPALQPDIYGRTTIHNAVTAGNALLLKFSLKKLHAREIGDILAMRDMQGKTPLHLAFERVEKNGEEDVIKTLWGAVPADRRFDVLVKRGSNHDNLLHYFISHEEEHDCERSKKCLLEGLKITPAHVKSLLEQGDDAVKGILRQAVEVNNVDFLRSLLGTFQDDTFSKDVRLQNLLITTDGSESFFVSLLEEKLLTGRLDMVGIALDSLNGEKREVVIKKLCNSNIVKSDSVARLFLEGCKGSTRTEGDRISVWRDRKFLHRVLEHTHPMLNASYIVSVVSPGQLIELLSERGGGDLVVLDNLKFRDIAKDQTFLGANLLIQLLVKLLSYTKQESIRTSTIHEIVPFATVEHYIRVRDYNKVFLLWLRLWPEEVRKAVLLEQDGNGYIVLSRVLIWCGIALIRPVLELLSKESCRAVLLKKDRRGNTVLQMILNWGDIGLLRSVLEGLSEDGLNALLMETDRDGNSVMHREASGRIEFLTLVLELLPEEARKAVLMKRGVGGDTLLQWMARERGIGCVRSILELLPEESRKALLMEEDGDGATVLHRVMREGDSRLIKSVLELWPEEERKAVLLKKDGSGDTVLHRVVSECNIGLMKSVLELLPEEARKSVLLEQDSFGFPVLHHMAYWTDIGLVRSILELLSEEVRRAVLLEEDKWGITVLLSGADWHGIGFVKAVLGLLPEEFRRDVLMKKDRWGTTVQHRVTSEGDIESIKFVLELWPKESRKALLLEKDEDGATVLHRVVNEGIGLMKSVLELLPEEARKAVLLEKDGDGCTVLHRIFSGGDRDLIPSALELWPEEEHKVVPLERDGDGKIVLHRVVFESEIKLIISVLELIPEEARKAVLLEKDGFGYTVLHRVCSGGDSVLIPLVLKLLPEEERKAVLLEKDGFGRTVKQILEGKPI